MSVSGKNTKNNYGHFTVILHWLIGLLFISILGLGAIMVQIGNRDLRQQLFRLHKSFGLLLILLVAIRIVWRIINKWPQTLKNTPKWQKAAAKTTHTLLYITMVIMPLSGWLMSSYAGYPPRFFGLITLAAPVTKNKAISSWLSQVHLYNAWLIATIITIHILAAIKHHYIDKDSVLKRMLPWYK